jgi:chromosome segregation ATPase
MEEIKQILLELSREVKEMSNDISQNNKEMKSLRENVRIMQVNWEKEKLDLEEKITKTEEKIEKLKKDKIRNNLIVTGMRMETGKETIHDITNNNGAKICDLAAATNTFIVSTQ